MTRTTPSALVRVCVSGGRKGLKREKKWQRGGIWMMGDEVGKEAVLAWWGCRF